MSQLSPKMKAIQQKYANDKQMLNVKMSEFYKEEKFNPAAGCLPMIIQMPIIFGVFALLRQPLLYMNSDMLFAVHESFLWIVDLTQPDKWVLPILAGIATYLSFLTTNNKQAQTQPGMANYIAYYPKNFPHKVFGITDVAIPFEIVSLSGGNIQVGATVYKNLSTTWEIGNQPQGYDFHVVEVNKLVAIFFLEFISCEWG